MGLLRGAPTAKFLVAVCWVRPHANNMLNLVEDNSSELRERHRQFMGAESRM